MPAPLYTPKDDKRPLLVKQSLRLEVHGRVLQDMGSLNAKQYVNDELNFKVNKDCHGCVRRRLESSHLVARDVRVYDLSCMDRVCTKVRAKDSHQAEFEAKLAQMAAINGISANTTALSDRQLEMIKSQMMQGTFDNINTNPMLNPMPVTESAPPKSKDIPETDGTITVGGW